MGDDDGSGDCEQADVLGPEDAGIFENIANGMDKYDVLFGNPKWLRILKK